MVEEYSDGIDTNGSLKYEKTQNRDITTTIERINRSEKFKDSAEDIVKLISPIIKNDAEKLFKELWRDNHNSHTNPNGLSISVDIVPPVHKKIHPEGDTDKFFKAHKEYPFYYLFNLKASFKFIPNESDPMKDDEAWYGKWFIDNIAPKFTKQILEKVRSALSTKFNNIFAFPTLDNSSKNTDTIENSVNKVENRINVVVTPILKFNKNNEDSGVNSRFDSTEDMRAILITMISLALERIVRV